MAPPTKHVLRLRRTDNKSEHMLVNVAKAGRKALDLKLIGTDKSQLFVVSFTEEDTKSYQDRNFRGNFEEWKTLLMFALLHHQPEGPLSEPLHGVETVAAINGSTATITIRKNLDGITQRLGTIHLPENTAGTEIDTFDWVDTTIAEAYDLRFQLEALQTSVESQKHSVAKLTSELDMLVRAKKQHEDELLSEFAALLNAKKLKIRDQQRLLNGARVDPDAAEVVSIARSSRSPRKAGISRGGKRKTKDPSPSAMEEENAALEEDEAGMSEFDAGASRRDQATPEPDEADAATETEDEDDVALHKSAARPVASQHSTRGRSKRADRMDVDVDEEEPSPQLSGTRKPPSRAAKELAPPPDSNVDDGDEDTDDEL